jgi:hypothetical protein
MRTYIPIFLSVVLACSGSATEPEDAGISCTDGMEPPAGDFCYPCNEAMCPCSGGEGITSCLPSGKGYGDCVCPAGQMYEPDYPDGQPKPDWGGGLCGPVTLCPACEVSTSQCCNNTEDEATLVSCSP